jgi:hypothetical protein
LKSRQPRQQACRKHDFYAKTPADQHTTVNQSDGLRDFSPYSRP